MPFVLRLTDEDTAALREQAEREHRSMHEVALLAVRERIGVSRRNEILDAIMDQIETEDAKLLAALGDA
jgi:hypothetical protein